ncbi:MAG: enoyl-CoA hydratase/isomerase family protein [Alphaproteobacteria bacterium]|jgi:2-(1,2-epoxy-1,2-dihydrophenyl)acetyl-CoA isomerase|nr:enoyl-CoA hydratase/isomerase family protein [Alphaproteobacteria bacterium]MBL6850795.1 enoyl-CoA hydratase/isomerase family protein [Alphaproteobacteria bacterium]
MKFKTINFKVENGVAFIELNRPKQYNSLNSTMAEDLFKVSLECDDNPEIRSVLLTGAGEKAFCAGGDLHSFYEYGSKMPAHLKEVTTILHGAISRFSRMNAPLIVAVNGVAAGAGFSFVGFADFVLASSNSSFISAYSKAGLTPDGSSTYFLPRIIGSRRYMELVLTNRVLSAKEALEWGLVNSVVDLKNLKSEAIKLAEQLAKGPSLAFGKLKNLVHNSFLDSLEGQMEFEARMIAESAKTTDGKNGIDAFVNKKNAFFEGE